MAPVRQALIIAPDDFPREYKDYAAACRALKLEPNGHCYLVCVVTTAAGPRTLLTVDLALLPGRDEAGTPDQGSVSGADRSTETASRVGAPSSRRYRRHRLLQDRNPLLPSYLPEAPRNPAQGFQGWLQQHPESSASPAPPPWTSEGDVQRLAVARVRFGVVRNPDAQAHGVAQPRRTNAPERLVVELQIASVPADRMDTFGALVQMPRGADTAHDKTGHLTDATAEYFAQQVDDQTRTVWATPGALGPEEVSAVLDSCQQSLLDSVRRQLQGLATGGGAPALSAELAAGIGANLILAPELRVEEDITWIVDICAMGIGFATGQPHLVVAAAKHLLHTEFTDALEQGVSEILTGWLNPAAPAAPGPSHEVPAPAAPARFRTTPPPKPQPSGPPGPEAPGPSGPRRPEPFGFGVPGP